ncbi:MAG: hypothetical protein KC478_15670, partial [Bacteriovoracaceae bacterium]|nr:hypothetical protein [Bacteriovoracaceae bacterium]
FVGSMDVNMSFISTTAPIFSEPLAIKDGNLFNSDAKDVGDIDASGFYVEEDNGDWMRFTKNLDGSTTFTGVYTDPSYGKVDVSGDLQTVVK